MERMLEGFAFLAARVHLKIDDEFPEITEALLSILYPHYIRPMPAMSVVEISRWIRQAAGRAWQLRRRCARFYRAIRVRGVAVPVPDLLRHHGVAFVGSRGGMEHAGPAVSAGQIAGGRAARTHGAASARGCALRKLGWIRSASYLTARAICVTRFTSCCAPTRCRSWCAIPRRNRASGP